MLAPEEAAAAGLAAAAAAGPVPVGLVADRLAAEDDPAGLAPPRPGALLAYADCVASQFGKQRGQLYARRVKAIQDPQFMADAASMKVMYLLSHVRPEGKFVLTSEQVLTKCEKNGIPTV